MGTIITRKEGKNTYYIYQETYREKVQSSDSGKVKGTGKSRVKTRAIYLGTAEKILENLKEKRKPLEVRVRNFGFIAAAYETAKIIELQSILKKYIKGSRYGTERWIYFFITIINRLDSATSKNKMVDWLKQTILPELMGIDSNKFTSRHFWSVTEDIISEKQVRKSIEDKEADIFSNVDIPLFNNIERELFKKIEELMGIMPNAICYDTTNFYTYIEEPKKSSLANTCHSKCSKHHLKHIGLVMAVDKSHGIPLFSRIYKATSHDSKVFSFVLSELIITLKSLCGINSKLILILDKGNNSKENFQYMSGKISWVGALTPSHYEDFLELELSHYHGIWKDKYYYSCKREIMGMECLIVLTFSQATKRKQEHSLKTGIEKLKQNIIEKWQSYKKPPKSLTKGITSMKRKSNYGAYFDIKVYDNKLKFIENEEAMNKRRERFGKNLIFSNMVPDDIGYIIDLYNEKNKIETDFQLLKDNSIISFEPIRHWTDSKIRAFSFCCVTSMTLIRVMEWMAEQNGYKMSPKVLKDELSDLKEVVMIYDFSEVERKVSERSFVQNKLWDIFNLGEINDALLLH